MIDVHAHLLPGVDDGPETLEDAVEMCRRAAADGCDVLIATPHQRHPHWWNGEPDPLRAKLSELRSAVGDTPRILLGSEIRIDPGILEAVDDLPHGTLLRLAESRYLLLEFGPEGPGPDPEATIHEIAVAGWTPIVAHPECVPWLAQRLEQLERMVELGALLQVTSTSLLGLFGRSPRDCVQKLLDRRLVSFVASDCHGLERRPPGLRAAFERLAKGWGEETAWRLTTSNPAAVIADRPLSEAA